MPGPWGIAIAQLRLASGWNKETAAKKASMTPTTYGRIERGGHTQTRKLRDIADAFRVSIEAVLVPHVSVDVDRAQLKHEIKEEIKREMKQAEPTHPTMSQGTHLLGRAMEEEEAAERTGKPKVVRKRSGGRRK